MSWFETRYLFAMLNLVACSGIGFVCMCRVAVMSGETTRKVTRAGYVALVAAAACSGWSPLIFGDWPGIADIVMSASVLVYLLSGKRAWSHGLPDFAKSDRAPLDTLKGSP